MILYYINNLKSGLKVLFEKQPCFIESVEFVKPGKGQVFSRIKLRKLLTGQLVEKTFRPTDTLLGIDVIDITFMYMYSDGKFWYFMHRETFEQITLDKNIIQNKSQWLVEQNDYIITLWNDIPIAITISNFMVLKVVSNDSVSKSNIMINHSKYKLCKLSTGVLIKVPIFIQIGDFIKVDTRTTSYISRINK